MELTLSPKERELLLRILEQHDQGLLKEIWHTDHREFRLALQEDEKVLDSLISRLRGALAEQPLG
jgi:DNA-binding response OmpR family regulator